MFLSACAACSRRSAEVRVAGLLELVRGVVEVFGNARAFASGSRNAGLPRPLPWALRLTPCPAADA